MAMFKMFEIENQLADLRLWVTCLSFLRPLLVPNLFKLLDQWKRALQQSFEIVSGSFKAVYLHHDLSQLVFQHHVLFAQPLTLLQSLSRIDSNELNLENSGSPGPTTLLRTYPIKPCVAIQL